MGCYKDMTFCDFEKCYYFENGCERSLTDLARMRADDLGLPICCYTEKPDCFISKEAHERTKQSMKLKDVK